LLLSLVDEIVSAELPLVFAALRLAGASAALVSARWLNQRWINVLPWRQLCEAFALPLLAGAEFQIYLCVAAWRYLALEVTIYIICVSIYLSLYIYIYICICICICICIYVYISSSRSTYALRHGDTSPQR